MNNRLKYIFSILIGMVSCDVKSDIDIISPNGNRITFSNKKEGEHIDKFAWGKIFFVHGDQKLDLSREDRYYTEDGSTKLSPLGEYVKVTSISGNYVSMGDEGKKYIDRAYCSVIDMKNGCIVSDWDGEACAYDWAKEKDVLSEEPNGNGDTFDFLSTKPKMKTSIDSFSTYSLYDINNLLRCDAPSEKNINLYQKLLRSNSISKISVTPVVVTYLSSLKKIIIIESKTYLYSLPNDKAKTKGYFISGDKVKIIQTTLDNQWANVGYVNEKGMPLITWIKQ